MSSTRCLFIGGPADGELIDINDATDWFPYRPRPPMEPITPYPRGRMAPDRVTMPPVTDYKRESLHTQNRTIYFFRPHDMTVDQAFDLLFHRYATGR